MSARFPLVVALSLAAVPDSIAAADASLTLAQARRQALEHNWEVLAARSGLELAEAQRIVAGEYPNPTFGATVGKIPSDGTPAGTSLGTGFWDRSYDTVLAIDQPIDSPRRRSLREDSAKAGIDAARARFDDARRVLDAAAIKAYVAAALAEENGRLLNRTATFLRESVEIARIRFDAGDISEADRNQIEVEADRFALAAHANEAAVRSARLALELITGEKSPSGDWHGADHLDDLVRQVHPEALETGGETRPDLLAAEAAARKTERDLSLEKALRFPTPSILLQYEHNPPTDRNTVGLGVSLDLPVWNRRKGEIAAAAVARDQANRDREHTAAIIASDRVAARASFDSARAQWQAYDGEILPKAEFVRRSSEFAFRSGGTSLLQLLEAERNANDLRLAAAQAASDTLSAAADLAAALNVVLLPEQR